MDAGLAVNPLAPISYERTDCERGTIQRCNDDAKNNLVFARFYHVMTNQRSILERFDRVLKMFATAQVTETSFILAKAVGNAPPSYAVECGCGDTDLRCMSSERSFRIYLDGNDLSRIFVSDDDRHPFGLAMFRRFCESHFRINGWSLCSC